MVYDFKNQPCEVGIHCHGFDLLLGSVVFAACFAPVAHQADLYALYQIQDFDYLHEAKRHQKYQLLRKLNHRLLGLVLKPFTAEQFSNAILQRMHAGKTGKEALWEFALKHMKALLKHIKRLGIKITSC